MHIIQRTLQKCCILFPSLLQTHLSITPWTVACHAPMSMDSLDKDNEVCIYIFFILFILRYDKQTLRQKKKIFLKIKTDTHGDKSTNLNEYVINLNLYSPIEILYKINVLYVFYTNHWPPVWNWFFLNNNFIEFQLIYHLIYLF